MVNCRAVVLPLTSLFGLMVGCGGRTVQPAFEREARAQGEAVGPVEPGEAPAGADAAPEYERMNLDSAQDFLPLIKVGAQEHGCSLVSEEPRHGVAYQCPAGLIFIVQKGRELRWSCQEAPRQTCGDILKQIVDKAVRAAGAGA
jgi:hypothetical protein